MQTRNLLRMRGAGSALGLLLIGGSTIAEEPAPIGTRHPDLSPDGRSIAFSYMGDIWTGPSSGGDATRITVHEAYDHSPRWSPDGARIAFSSNRFGNDDIFVVDRDGGRPERLTCHSSDDKITGWTADGKEVYFTSRREATQPFLFRTARGAHHPRSVIRERTVEAASSPGGEWICWVKGFTPWWRKHYRGSASRDLWLRKSEGGESVRLTSWEGDDDDPMWSPDGRAIYYLSEREDSVANIWKVGTDLTADDPRAVGKPQQITSHDKWSIESASISRNGELIVYERHGRLWTVPTSGGSPKQIPLVARSDDKWNPVRREEKTSEATEFALSPDEEEIALVVHGEVFVMELKEGLGSDRIRRITRTAARERDIAWDPEGGAILFVSDREGNNDIFLVRSTDDDEKRLSRSRSTETIRLTDSPENEFTPVPSPDRERILFRRGAKYLYVMKWDRSEERLVLSGPDVYYGRWSPDSRWIAASQSNLGSLEDVTIVPAGGGDVYNVSRSPLDDYSPFWTDDGKRLTYATRDDYGNLWLRYAWLTKEDYLRSEKEWQEEEEAEEERVSEDEEKEQPVEVRIDLDKLYARVKTVTRLAGSYYPYAVSPDGKFFAVLSDQLGDGDLWLVTEKGDRVTRLTEGGAKPELFQFRSDSRGIYFLRKEGEVQRITFDDEGNIESGPETVEFEARFEIDLAAEAEQKFREAWGLLYDGFYDRSFHGVDWPELKSEYEPRALAAYTVEEFSDVLSEMIGELSASHLGVYPPKEDGDITAAPGYLIEDSYGGPGVRVASVLPNSPADREESRIEEGEYILEVDGKPISDGANYYALWNRKAGEEVDLVVAESPNGRGSRKITLTPVSPKELRTLLYERWVLENREITAHLSDGRIGYVHMKAMGSGDIERFEKDLWAEAGDREGLILDIRFNNGGFVHDQVITILQRRAYAKNKSRGRGENLNPYERWEKPIVCLINERSYSDGEIFPHAFKTLGLGTLVGRPTYGAVIGTSNVKLIDGTVFRIPGSGWFSLDDKDLENRGVAPDVPIASVPEERAQGRDQQLERAVEVLLEKVGSQSISAK